MVGIILILIYFSLAQLFFSAWSIIILSELQKSSIANVTRRNVLQFKHVLLWLLYKDSNKIELFCCFFKHQYNILANQFVTLRQSS